MKTLISRAYAICSNYVSFDIELKFLQQYFSNNGYPIFLFYRYVKEFLSKLCNSEEETECSNNFLYINFLFFGPQSDKLKFELSSLFSKYLSDVTPRIILNNGFTLSSLFQHKDKLSTALRSSVVYKFSCMQCMLVYIGSTCRRLHTRVSEHAGVSPRTGLPLSSPSRTSILDHITACETNANLSNFSIIGTSNSNFEFRTLESLHVNKNKPVLNPLGTEGLRTVRGLRRVKKGLTEILPLILLK